MGRLKKIVELQKLVDLKMSFTYNVSPLPGTNVIGHFTVSILADNQEAADIYVAETYPQYKKVLVSTTIAGRSAII